MPCPYFGNDANARSVMLECASSYAAQNVQENPHRQSRRNRRPNRASLPRNGHSSPSPSIATPTAPRCMSAWPTKPIPIGPAPSRESYLRIDKLMDVARRAGCDALHPGYGFLAENPELPRACAANHITFIGPSPEAMERLGSKTAARQLAARAGVPMVPGVAGSHRKSARRRAHRARTWLSRAAQSRGRWRRKRHAPGRRRKRNARGMARRLFGSAQRVWRRAAFISSDISTGRATSKSRFSATCMATSCISANANARCSAGTRR